MFGCSDDLDAWRSRLSCSIASEKCLGQWRCPGVPDRLPAFEETASLFSWFKRRENEALTKSEWPWLEVKGHFRCRVSPESEGDEK